MNSIEDEKIAFLREAHADEIHHSDRALLDHLVATAGLLEHWGARAAVCDAGLYHSVYGTEFFRSATVDQARRTSVQQRIGAEAERLAWLFCAMQRDRFEREAAAGTPGALHFHAGGEPTAVTAGEVADLANIVAANAVEQLPRLPRRARAMVVGLLAMRAHLLETAIAGLEQFLPTGAVSPGLSPGARGTRAAPR